jgi:hypothetical protein
VSKTNGNGEGSMREIAKPLYEQVQVLFAWDPKDVLDTPAFKSIHEQL